MSDGAWASVAASSFVAAVLVDDSGRVIDANERFAELVGSGREELMHLSISDLLDGGRARTRWREAVEKGAKRLELQIRSAHGSPCVLRGDLERVSLASGRAAICGTFIDASEELKLRNALQRNARLEALSSLTSGVAHDFNNLLTVLVGNLSLAAEEMRGEPSVFAKLKSARDAARRGSDLIGQLLSFARRESAEADFIDPGRVVGNLTELLKRALGTKIELATKIEAGAGPVRGNVAILESAIVNLTVNARDAVGADGAVTISVRNVQRPAREIAGRRLSGGEYVEISVADNGCGISPKVLTRVFEPFFSTKRDHGGTGLGLSMVRTFAEAADGCVLVDSEEGRGTTVSIELPRCPDGVEESAARTMPLSTLPTGNERVVVLSRDESLRATVCQILEVLGYRLLLADDVSEAIESLGGPEPPLLILDGAQAEELSIRDPGLAEAVRSIVLAAGTETPLGERSVTLRKPFSLADLAGTVRETLDAPTRDAS